jgi:hypothetical protein
MTMRRLAIIAALVAAPAAADPLPLMTCIPHADLAAAMKAQGAALFATGALADGRKLEFYMDAAGAWTPVVVSRPTGSVTKTSCSVIFGQGDPGAFIPPP